MTLTVTTLLRKPSAWLPLALSLAAIGLIVAHVALVGVARQADEGAEARIFQLLMLIDAVAIGAFAVRWLPVAPQAAFSVLALQLMLAAIPLITIAALDW
jgi:membrane-bound ClpP family serine protease